MLNGTMDISYYVELRKYHLNEQEILLFFLTSGSSFICSDISWSFTMKRVINLSSTSELRVSDDPCIHGKEKDGLTEVSCYAL